MISDARRQKHREWLEAVTAIPTAAGREGRVIRWIEDWVAKRREDLRLRRDAAGNLIITRRGRRPAAPLYITAHLDHPAFVLRAVDGRAVDLEFRGSVHPPYFKDAMIEIFDTEGTAHRAKITHLDADAKPFKLVKATLTRTTKNLEAGDVGRWKLSGNLPRVTRGILHTYACDDLAAVAAALAALDVLRKREGMEHIGVLFTRAEEVGFLGTLAVCEARSLPEKARLICLENSRSFPESPIGAGPILRVGDKMSVFDPRLTNRINEIMLAYAAKRPDFLWQRKLMPGGSCEATAFSAYGYETTCLCLPLGNYHNMADIDGVLAGKVKEAKVGPEFIAVADFHGLVEMLVVIGMNLDRKDAVPMRERLARYLETVGYVLEEPT